MNLLFLGCTTSTENSEELLASIWVFRRTHQTFDSKFRFTPLCMTGTTVYITVAFMLITIFRLTIVYNGENILWSCLRMLFDSIRTESGLYMGKKLKLDHINLTFYSKMWVSLAAQVRFKMHMFNILLLLLLYIQCQPKETERLSRVAKMAPNRGAKRTSTNRY